MGLFSSSVRALVPVRTRAIAASIPTWQEGVVQHPEWDYSRGAREGYALDEIVFACVELRSTSAAEPPMVAYRSGSDEKVKQHAALTLLNNPNPFMGRARFWASIVMCMDIGGNAYVEKVRSAAGKVVQLWPLRPDRMTVIPSERNFIGGYKYTLGERPFYLPPEDVIHFKTRHPLDDFYGLAPLAVLAGRVDLDVAQRKFTEAFFKNAGVPAGLLNVVRQLTVADRENYRREFARTYGGENIGKLLVLDGGQATYAPMGLPLGSSGAAMGEGNQLNETRICAVYGVMTSLIPTMAGMNANRGQTAAVSDRELFWESTMVPLIGDLDSTLTMGLADDFPDLDHLEHDLSTVKALQEDVDKAHARHRADYLAGGLTWKEYRRKLGETEEPDEPGMLLLPTNVVETWSDDMLTEPEPMPALPAGPGAPGLPAPTAVPANGRNGAH